MGLGSLAVQLLRAGVKDSFVMSAHAILIGFLAQALLNSIFLGVLGFMVWTFAAMSLAAAQSNGAAEFAEECEARVDARFAAAATPAI